MSSLGNRMRFGEVFIKMGEFWAVEKIPQA